MTKKENIKNSALYLQGGVSQPPSINPALRKGISPASRKRYTVEEYYQGIITGNRTILSRAITLLESSAHRHFEIAQKILERCLPESGKSFRIGITGVPGAGKSTFIETFGKLLTSMGKRTAVLAIDPSSVASRGSILGDKTRMQNLSTDPDAFIRPSPSAGTLGGVARKTRETIILCEAAGFDTILVETVGVGQSEVAVSSMVDFFLLILVAGAGDELQGMKRGIIEMADLILINKADGDNRMRAEKSASEYGSALHLFPLPPSGWKPAVMTCSSLKKESVMKVWDTITEYFVMVRQSGWFEERRKQQAVLRMYDTIIEQLENSFYSDEAVRKLRTEVEDQLREGRITSYKAAWTLLNKYFRK